MVESDANFNRNQGLQFSLENRDDRQEISIPAWLISRNNLERAKNLNDIPQPLDVLTSANTHQYITISLNEISTIAPATDESSLADGLLTGNGEVSLSTRDNGLTVVQGIDLDQLLADPKTQRQIQRLGQYKKVRQQIEEWQEKLLHNRLDINDRMWTQSTLKILKRTAIYWYMDELYLESFTREFAREINGQGFNREKEEAIAEAETIIRDGEFSLEEVFAEVEAAIHHPKRDTNEMSKPTTEEEQRADKEQEEKEKAAKLQADKELSKKRQEETMLDAIADAEYARSCARFKREGVLYVHDPVDEPSEGAAAYVKELLQRPF